MNFTIISPETKEELLEAIADIQGINFRFGAGYSDLILELKKQPDEGITVINLARLNNELFTSIGQYEGGIRIGALVTANRIASDKELHGYFPVLRKAAHKLASRQIRQIATIGGNLCTASPAGDIACALVALEAQCEILSARGTIRVVPINSFFTDVRKIDIKRDEVLRSVSIASNRQSKKLYSDYIKIGTRRSMECSVVSLAYHIQTDENDIITRAGIAIGSVSPTIKFVKTACDYLAGKNISSISLSDAEEFAAKVLEYASPISDIRASAWYRKKVLYNISKSIFSNK